MQARLNSANYKIQERKRDSYLKGVNIRTREELFSLDEGTLYEGETKSRQIYASLKRMS